MNNLNSQKASTSFTVSEICEKLSSYCAYQDRCHWEVEKKLDEFSLIPEARDEIIIYLIEANFLNEERFAKSFARGKFYQKNWGKLKIQLELKRRKITKNLISKAMLEIDENDYISTAQKLIEKKLDALNSEKNSWTKNAKILNYMIQKGYEKNLILEILTTK